METIVQNIKVWVWELSNTQQLAIFVVSAAILLLLASALIKRHCDGKKLNKISFPLIILFVLMAAFIIWYGLIIF